MIIDENNPRMIKAHRALLQRLGTVLGDGTNELTKLFLDHLFEVVKNHRTECRQKGIDFPVMVALVVPRLGVVEFVRADLDIESLRVKIINFVRMHPDASMLEVAQAFSGAYPGLKPDDVLSGHQSGTDASVRMIKRMTKTAQDYLKEQGVDDKDDTGSKNN